jgi:glucose dehydrogenase
MRPRGVVVGDPGADEPASLIEIDKQALVEKRVTRHVVHDVENAKAPAVGELVMDEVERPACVGLSLDQDRCACPDRSAPDSYTITAAPLHHDGVVYSGISGGDLMSPGGNGGVNWAPMAYSPRTNYFYVTAADRLAARIAPGSGRVAPPAFGAKYGGTLTAVDSRINKIAWQKRMPYSIGQGSGSLVTASDVLFHGEPDGNFQAYDARNGELLWQWQTGAGADAPAITYEIDGVQYVAIASGGLATQTASSNGDMVWAFSLQGSPSRSLKFVPTLPDLLVQSDRGP